MNGPGHALAGLLRDVAQTVLRMIPWPTEPGLRPIGDPDSDSPVLVTCNYDLTVRRVTRALAGCDAWLVVAPSAGINVWCAAAGGHFGTHQVVTALKTCGVDERVRHRRAILPQLGATGIRARDVARRCGWKVRFGPAYAADLPRYLGSDGNKDEAMRRVRFDAFERLEMAVAWGVPAAVLVAGLVAIVRPAWSLPLAALALGLALAIFFVYDRLTRAPGLMLGIASAAVSLLLVSWAGGGNAALLTALGAPLFLVTVLTFDYTGSTPTAGGSHFEERRWHIVVDNERCRGVFSCFEVCPEACFEKQQEPRLAFYAHPDACIRCGACVVQCSQDAVYFEDDNGRYIAPETIRRYKLNLMGKRAIDAGGEQHP